MASRSELAPGEPLLRTLRAQRITHATLPPVAVGALPSGDDLSLSTLIVGGEACPPALVQQWAPGRRFINAYGPTEATVCASMHDCERQRQASGNVPIGRPIANAQIYILDRHCQVVPIGVVGEIYIGGAGIARGYLNRPELTAERFLRDPFSTEPDARMYKTGDLGRWRPDGNVEYLGRNDFQVKIRGFRIELGEIEARLAACPGVRDAVVLAREDAPGDKRLVAYLTSVDGQPLSAAPLREQLSKHLAEYMVPSAFVTLEALPLTPNGKLDRKALPAPRDVTPRNVRAVAGSRTERSLVAIWAKHLALTPEHISVTDTFFELGGHSLLSLAVQTDIKCVLGIEIGVADLFQYPTIQSLARFIDGMAERPADRSATFASAKRRILRARPRSRLAHVPTTPHS